MSILFEALNKAARDYRRQHAPVIVPLLSMRSPPFLYGRRIAVSAVLAALIIGIGVGFMAFGNAPPSQHTINTSAAEKPQPTHKVPHDDPSGIALMADSLDPQANSMDAVQDLANKIKETPALTGASGLVVMQGAGEPAMQTGAFAIAASAIEVKDWRGALRAYNGLLAEDQNNQEALSGKIFVLEQRGSDQDLDELTSMAASLPKLAAIHAARARLFVQRQEMPEALNAWQRAVDCDPKNATYRLGLAILNDKLGRSAEALRLYHEIPAPLPPEAQQRAAYLAASLAPQEGSNASTPNDEEE